MADIIPLSGMSPGRPYFSIMDRPFGRASGRLTELISSESVRACGRKLVNGAENSISGGLARGR